MRSIFGMKFEDGVNTALLCAVAASIVAWLGLLRPAGEDSREAPATLGPEYESRLLAHLDAINNALLKAERGRHEHDAVPR
jgi:hypothetical protein